jgi:hypothetical protein
MVWAPLNDLGVCESGDVGGVELLELKRVRQPRALWRRCRLWKISRYSKIALASSTRVVHRWRSRSRSASGPKGLDHGVVVGVTDGAH